MYIPIKDISEMWGVHASTIWRWCKKWGLHLKTTSSRGQEAPIVALMNKLVEQKRNPFDVCRIEEDAYDLPTEQPEPTEQMRDNGQEKEEGPATEIA